MLGSHSPFLVAGSARLPWCFTCMTTFLQVSGADRVLTRLSSASQHGWRGNGLISRETTTMVLEPSLLGSKLQRTQRLKVCKAPAAGWRLRE